MSTPRKSDGVAPRQRCGLSRNRRSVRFDFRPGVYEQLLKLGRVDSFGRPEPAVATVERLIQTAHDALLGRSQ